MVIATCTYLGNRLAVILPIRGKQLTHHGQAAYPCWASSVHHFGVISKFNPIGFMYHSYNRNSYGNKYRRGNYR